MITSIMAAVPATALAPQAPPGVALGAAPVSDPVADGSLSEEDHALQRAAETGRPVEVVSRRTESSDTWAQPGGGFKVAEYGTPVRLWREGGWITADPSLEFAADGSVVTRATSVAVKFSGGGTAPLIQGAMNGRSLSLTWPSTLPRPTLDGNVATYAEVLPGVDLQLKAEVEGFSQVFVVKTPQAAQNPELARLQFGVRTDGLTVAKDPETGSLSAVDPGGQVVFSSSAPMMWDSTKASAPAARSAGAARTTMMADTAVAADDGSTFDPGLGARDAVMPTELTADSLTITPDQGLLTGADTTYPVYIDPSWGYGDRQKWNWTRVYKAYPGQSFWNSKDPVRVGYESQTGGSDRISRSFFQLDVSHLKDTEVKSATFRVKNTWSWSCQARPVHLYPTGDITSRTSWNNQPGKLTGTPLSTVNDSKGWIPPSGNSACPAGNLEFDATSWVKSRAQTGAESVTFGLYADETDTFGWKKFDPKTVVLETEYNTPPNLPSKLGTNPVTPCASGATLGNVAVSLYATITDEDKGNLTAEFELYEKNKSGASSRVFTKSVPALNGRVATLAVPVPMTPGGDDVSYTWRVRTIDPDRADSGWKNAPCAFQVDRQRPKSPPKIVSPVGPDGKEIFPAGDAGWPTTTGKARQKVVFTFQPVESDIKKIHWWTDTDPDVNEVSPVNSVYSGLVSIPSYGPHMIYAYSVDAAGNRSDTAVYLYYANKDQERDELHDVNGDRFKDIWSPDSNGTLLAYTGHGDRTFSTMNAASGGAVFPGQQVAMAGDWQQDGYNDLLALVPNPNQNGAKDLQVYKNNGSGLVNTDEGPKTLRAKAGSRHWDNADQVIGGDFNADTVPDVLVKQADKLWFYRGAQSNDVLGAANGIVPIGDAASKWNKYTIVSTGDINGDKLPDLLLRDDTTGDVFRSHATADPANPARMNFATWGRNPVKIAGGLTKSLYPQIGTSGDLDGDGSSDGVTDGDKIIDLWARKADNTMTGWRGKGTPTSLTGLDAPYIIDGVTGGIRLAPKTVIPSGHSITGQSSTLTMRLDGNLVITSKADKVLWSTKTGGNEGATARVERNGNISVVSMDGLNILRSTAATTTTADGYAVLHDRGSLVVYDAKGQSLWSSGTAVRHDYDNDGRSDIAAWYDYADGHAAVHTMLTDFDGKFRTPLESYKSAVGSWLPQNMKTVTGDFNGDGHGDMATLYAYESTRTVRLFTALGQKGGGFGAPFPSWTSQPNSWSLPGMSLLAGDFNGDGRDDVAVWYDYADGHDTLFTFTTNVRGGFNAPFPSHTLQAGRWNTNDSKFVTGDFDGDGRDDLGALYGYPDGSVKMHTFLTSPTGAFTPSFTSWGGTITSWGDWNRTYIHAGDFNGDGIDDVTAWYDYADGHDALHTLISTADRSGKFSTPVQGWESAVGNWYYPHMKIVPGDYNGDGRDDLGAMYGYSDGSVRMFTWTATATGGFNPSISGWDSTNWSFARTKLLSPY
ncbi:FG-GAP-like repeat-containing protein [Streptomyces sp. NPDC088557]|uniref:FG-GAP-like repeat-containing protein n=1 Tax=Streptomyces sp. NPDC088557 TaxID=3365867 RepID=UPI00382BF830